jgi:hypothetical protein
VLWCNPPFTDTKLRVTDILQHSTRCRARDPSTSVCFIPPNYPCAEWEYEIASKREEMQCATTYAQGGNDFFSLEGGNHKTNWDVQVWWCAPHETGTPHVRDAANPVQLRPRRPKFTTAATQQYRRDTEARLAVQKHAGLEGRGVGPVATEGAAVPRMLGVLEALTTAHARAYCNVETSQLLDRGETRHQCRMAAGLV